MFSNNNVHGISQNVMSNYPERTEYYNAEFKIQMSHINFKSVCRMESKYFREHLNLRNKILIDLP